jgi:hypothetical protein
MKTALLPCVSEAGPVFWGNPNSAALKLVELDLYLKAIFKQPNQA